MTILIPAYNPDDRLATLIFQLSTRPYRILIVDDGSRPDTQDIFRECEASGCTVLRHVKNLGKGAALKTGFTWLKENSDHEGVVCADADGQHLPEDIDAIARELLRCPGRVVLGTRRFDGKMPWRNRFGNTVTRWVFRLASGQKLYDTQTGLRGYPNVFLDWLLQVKGKRFEYEMNLLLYTAANDIPIRQVQIQTVYEARHTTHFRPVRDSVRVYQPILRYCGSSLVSAGVDFLMLFILKTLTKNLFVSVAGARIVSASLNYTINRQFVFSQISHGHKSEIRHSLPRFAMVAGLVMLANYCVIFIYSRWLGMELVTAKILTELTIYLFSFWLQRKFVFSSKEHKNCKKESGEVQGENF